MKTGLYSFAIVIALAGCSGEAPDRSDDGLVFQSGSYTYAIDKACVSDIALDHDEASNPVVTVALIDSAECSGELREFTNTHVGDPMSIRFDDEDEGLTLDTDSLSAAERPFVVQVDSDERGRAIIEYYR
ncbi:hypothetical protein M1D97_00245 [Kushneria sp. AK178]